MQNKNIPKDEPPVFFTKFEVHLKPITVEIGAWIRTSEDIEAEITKFIKAKYKADVDFYTRIPVGKSNLDKLEQRS